MNSCLVDMIAHEHVLKNHKKLKRAKIKTIPYSTTFQNTLTGETWSHAEMVFYYKGDTWHYSNHSGSTKVILNRCCEDLLEITKKVYSSWQTDKRVVKVMPLDLVANFVEHSRALPDKYVNKY